MKGVLRLTHHTRHHHYYPASLFSLLTKYIQVQPVLDKLIEDFGPGGAL